MRGDLQESSTMESTYAATLAARSFRIVMALAAQFDLEIIQLDVVNAFVHAERSKQGIPITCELPEGFKKPGVYIELDRALYGLRDSPQIWFNDFTTTLKKLGMIQSKEEPCLLYTKARDAFLVFFVDDILVLYHRDTPHAAQSIINRLKNAYELTEKGNAEWFLGIKIVRDRSKHIICLGHDAYIEKIAGRFGQDNSNHNPTIPIPIQHYTKNQQQATAQEIKSYQEKVGSLLYTAIMIRPDVAFAASTLSRYLTNPSQEHHKAADQAIRYLYITRNLAI